MSQIIYVADLYASNKISVRQFNCRMERSLMIQPIINLQAHLDMISLQVYRDKKRRRL